MRQRHRGAAAIAPLHPLRSVAATFTSLARIDTTRHLVSYSEYKATGKTTADTTRSASAGSKVKREACVDIATGSLVSLTGGKFHI